MENYLFISIGESWLISQSIPESQSSDNVTVEIRRISDGATWNFSTLIFEVLANSAPMQSVGSGAWKASFTPPTRDRYVVTITDATLDVKYVQTLIAVTQVISNVKANELWTIIQGIPESQPADTVTIKIIRLADSYTWNFNTTRFELGSTTGNMLNVSGIVWKQTFTPPSAGTYLVIIDDVTLDAQHFQTIVACAEAVAEDPVESTPVTAASMLALVETAISNRLAGGAVQSYSINGRNIQYMSLTELFSTRDRLKREASASRGQATNYASFSSPI